MVPAMKLPPLISAPWGQGAMRLASTTIVTWPSWPAWLLPATCVLVLAGCASGPGRNAGSVGRAPAGVPPVVARSGPANPSERDGPPPVSEAPSPAQLAALPDPVPQVEPIREGGPNKPYTVLGQSYAPLTRDVPLKERGQASWYGKKFHGRRTASGELFSMYGLTAAHRTLPIPSYARVTDVRTGKAVIVRVNDRGPFHSSRVMDLSYAAAVKLGIASRGSAEIEVERLTFEDIRTGAWQRGADEASPPLASAATMPPADEPVAMPALAPLPVAQPVAAAMAPLATLPPPTRAFTPFAKGFWVQLAALGKRDGVDRLQQRVATELQHLQPLLAVYHEAALFKLQVGPYGSREEAVAAADQAREVLEVKPLVIERR
jgi:rare lipoprotein A